MYLELRELDSLKTRKKLGNNILENILKKWISSKNLVEGTKEFSLIYFEDAKKELRSLDQRTRKLISIMICFQKTISKECIVTKRK